MVDVRTEIWDYLYRNGPTPLELISSGLSHSQGDIQTAVLHEWFTVEGDVVAIAVASKAQSASTRSTPPTKASEDASRQALRDLFGS